MSNIFEILGSADDHPTCELCGRADLKRTVVLRDRNTDEVVHYGTDCAARAANWTVREVEMATRDADAQARDVARIARDEALATESRAWEAWLAERSGINDVTLAIAALGGFAAARSRWRDEHGS